MKIFSLFKVAKSNFRVFLNSKETLLVNFNIQSLFYIINEITEGLSNGLLICTLISENLGLEKSRFVSNLRKICGPAHLDFFSVCHLDFFQVYGIKLAFFSRWRPRKKFQVCRTWNFSKVWSKQFSEIKVQIKRPEVWAVKHE